MEFQPPILHLDTTGELRIGESRVTLDRLLAVYQAGATPEDIAAQHPGLAIADIYSTIAYYLSNKQLIDGYLEQLRQTAQHPGPHMAQNPRLFEMGQRLLNRHPSSVERGREQHLDFDSPDFNSSHLDGQADYS